MVGSKENYLLDFRSEWFKRVISKFMFNYKKIFFVGKLNFVIKFFS